MPQANPEQAWAQVSRSSHLTGDASLTDDDTRVSRCGCRCPSSAECPGGGQRAPPPAPRGAGLSDVASCIRSATWVPRVVVGPQPGAPWRAALRILTCDDGWDAPAHDVVEPHGPGVDVAHLGQHAVDVQALHEGPGEGAHVHVVQENGDHRAQELRGEAAAQRSPPARGPCTTDRGPDGTETGAGDAPSWATLQT